MLGGVDHACAALLGELFDERGSTDLLDEQDDVDGTGLGSSTLASCALRPSCSLVR